MTENYLLEERRYTERETAALLGVSKMTVRRKRESGQLGYYRIGTRILIAETHILDSLKRNEVAHQQAISV